MKLRKILVWFRNDLRLHDNEMLVEAIAKSDAILPVYFFDPRYFEQTKFGTSNSGRIRSQFLIESVSALRASLQSLGGDLMIVHGTPEEHIPALVEKYDIAEVYHHREVAAAETLISANVEDLLWKLKVNLKHFIGHTLYNKEDLPFPIKDIPDVFSQFKKKTERDAMVKACFAVPEVIKFVDSEIWGLLPEYDHEPTYATGGEQKGLDHLQNLLEADSLIYVKGSAKSTLDKPGFTSRLSAWLTLGCLSPRKVYWQVKEAEAKFGGNSNFSQLILGLLWRDYFRFMFKKHGNAFVKEVDSHLNLVASEDELRHLEAWKNGLTGHVAVDKYMSELNASGFIPHAARLLVATFLIYILKVDWTSGAAYFEEKLIDYAPASNWGNWAIVAGGTKDSRSKNAFDLDKQFKLLDVQQPNAFA